MKEEQLELKDKTLLAADQASSRLDYETAWDSPQTARIKDTPQTYNKHHSYHGHSEAGIGRIGHLWEPIYPQDEMFNQLPSHQSDF